MDVVPIPAQTNPTLDLLDARCSTRTYAPTPITAAEKAAILHSTMRAPTAGNMMLYSIVEVTDPALKERLAVTCDDQPFIAKAPWVLLFVADMQKWIDLFRHSRVEEATGVEHRMTPGLGDLAMSLSDALIAAQNAVVAAESLGIGSCYIGDIFEQAEIHAELFDLPPHVMPAAMLCFGRAAATRPPVSRYEANVVHENRYRRMTEADLEAFSEGLLSQGSTREMPQGIANIGQLYYRRKHATEFMAEMNRSTEWWLERWQTAEG